MKTIIKPSSILNIKEEQALTDAFLFGIKDFSVNNCFSVTVPLLKRIKKMYNIKIFVSLNKNIFNKDIEKLKKLLIELDKLSIEGILFYDLSVLFLWKKLNIKTPLIWNQNYFVTNYETCNFYKEKCVSGAIISKEITEEEIKEISENTKMDLFMNVFGYQVMSYSKRKFVTNYFKYKRQINLCKTHFIQENNKNYYIKEEKEGTAILSCYVLNLLKNINNLKKYNIKYILLDEEYIEHDKFLEVLKIYKNAVDFDLNTEKLEILNEKINNIVKNTSTGFLFKKTIYKVKK